MAATALQPNVASVVIDLGAAATWTASNANKSISVPAQVPGVIHTDLLAAGVISDPYLAYNDGLQQWVAFDNWTYSGVFTLDPAVLSTLSRIQLVAEGLDTIATVTLNGQDILSADNMFKRYDVDVKSILNLDGENTLVVAFLSAIDYAAAQYAAYPNIKTHDIPPVRDGVSMEEGDRAIPRIQ